MAPASGRIRANTTTTIPAVKRRNRTLLDVGFGFIYIIYHMDRISQHVLPAINRNCFGLMMIFRGDKKPDGLGVNRCQPAFVHDSASRDSAMATRPSFLPLAFPTGIVHIWTTFMEADVQ